MAALENRPFENRTFQNGRISLDHFINKKYIFTVKLPRLTAILVRFSNGPHHSKTKLWTIQKKKKKNIRKPNFKMFGIRMDSEFECSEFEPPL